MDEKWETKNADQKVTSGSKFTQILRYCLKRRDGLFTEDLTRGPEPTHRDITSSGAIPLALREAGFVCPCKRAIHGKRCLNLFSAYNIQGGSYVLGGCFTLYVLLSTLWASQWRRVRVPKKNYLLSIPSVTRGTKSCTPLWRFYCHKVSSLFLRAFNFVWGITT